MSGFEIGTSAEDLEVSDVGDASGALMRDSEGDGLKRLNVGLRVSD